MPDAIVEREGHLMTITMNRPKRYNALSGEMLIRMYDAYEDASNDPEVRCILVTGAGGFIGSHVVDALLAAGVRVTGFDNFCDFYAPARKRENLHQAASHPACTIISGDIRDGDVLRRGFRTS